MRKKGRNCKALNLVNSMQHKVVDAKWEKWIYCLLTLQIYFILIISRWSEFSFFEIHLEFFEASDTKHYHFQSMENVLNSESVFFFFVNQKWNMSQPLH